MRKNIVAGNWKMNKTLQEGIHLAEELNNILKNKKVSCDIILAPPFTHLASIAQVVDPKLIKVAAQNCSDKEQGAYTGEVSAEMIKSTGASHVIIGHSERRQYYHETNEIIKNKITIALKTGLNPIFCFGELLAERESNRHFEVVKTQLHESLFALSPDDFSKIVLSYEPVWAIGTGKNASVEQAEEIHAFVRQELQKKYGQQVANDTTILYGGSCKPSNAKELFSSADVDGGLIGGASLVAADFMGIIESF
ncbi:MAG: triose-phosphate isomerase [Paludibacteraceae bacterium]|nr:triose-phosphate isomerase [Paludibacteraceae bacterium]